MSIFDKIKNWGRPSAEDRIKTAYFAQVILHTYQEHKSKGGDWYNIKIKSLDNAENYLEVMNAQEKVNFLFYCIREITAYYKSTRGVVNLNKVSHHRMSIAIAYLKHLCGGVIHFTEEVIQKIIEQFSLGHRHISLIHDWPIKQFLQTITKQYQGIQLADDTIRSLEWYKKQLLRAGRTHSERETHQLTDLIDGILFKTQHGDSGVVPTKFRGEDILADYANPILEALPKDQKIIWYQLLALAHKVKGGKPNNKFIKASTAHLEQLGKAHFWAFARPIIEFVTKSDHQVVDRTYSHFGRTYTLTDAIFLSAPNLDTMKGIVWMTAQQNDQQTLALIANLAERGYKKMPGVGPAAAALGNACFYALYQSEGLEGIAQLSRLKLKIKQSSAIKLIDKYLGLAAEEKGISIQELEELAVEDYGLL
ncbi:MAG: hypothetical protein AAF242_16360, partial [Bacteroidota bacterium]